MYLSSKTDCSLVSATSGFSRPRVALGAVFLPFLLWRNIILWAEGLSTIPESHLLLTRCKHDSCTEQAIFNIYCSSAHGNSSEQRSIPRSCPKYKSISVHMFQSGILCFIECSETTNCRRWRNLVHVPHYHPFLAFCILVRGILIKRFDCTTHCCNPAR
jgi:hypothetical protein